MVRRTYPMLADAENQASFYTPFFINFFVPKGIKIKKLMMKNLLCHTRSRVLFYPITALATIVLSAPLQADAPFQLRAGQSGAKYGAVAFFCEQRELEDYTPPSAETCGVGYSNNHASQEEANQQAIQNCDIKGCEIVAEFTNACFSIAGVSDTWEYNGETIGYRYQSWTDQGDALKYPLLSDLEPFIIDFCNSFVQQKEVVERQMPGYTFKACSIIESSCSTPFLSLSPEKETFSCDEAVTINVSPIEGEWIPVINGAEGPPRSLKPSMGPFKGCNTSWDFYLKHPNDASIVSNTVNLTWGNASNYCELERPHFDGNALRIPKIQLANEFYGVELGVVPDNPIQFEVSELKNADGKVIYYRKVSEQSADKYGAIARFCDAEDNMPASDTCGIGYSNNHASQEEANQQAIKKCGVSGCEVIVELTNACAAIADVADTWEHNGETIGYTYNAWSDQEVALDSPLLPDLEKGLLDFCLSFVQEKGVGQMPGYTFKPCVILESSCPTNSPAPAK